MVDWLYTHLEGFRERREARRYASSMLKRGFLRHTVNKVTFSEQCYYVFGDLCSSEWGPRAEGPGGPARLPLPAPPPADLAALNLNSGSSGASDQDTLAPLPHPAAPWPLGQGYPYQYPGPPPCFPPAYQDPGFSYGSGSAGSQQSEGEGPPASVQLPACPPGSALLPTPSPPPALCAPTCSVLGPWVASSGRGEWLEASGVGGGRWCSRRGRGRGRRWCGNGGWGCGGTCGALGRSGGQTPPPAPCGGLEPARGSFADTRGLWRRCVGKWGRGGGSGSPRRSFMGIVSQG